MRKVLRRLPHLPVHRRAQYVHCTLGIEAGECGVSADSRLDHFRRCVSVTQWQWHRILLNIVACRQSRDPDSLRCVHHVPHAERPPAGAGRWWKQNVAVCDNQSLNSKRITLPLLYERRNQGLRKRVHHQLPAGFESRKSRKMAKWAETSNWN